MILFPLPRLLFLPLPALSVHLSAHETAARDLVANEPALRVNAQVIGVREVLALYADSRTLIQENLARGE